MYRNINKWYNKEQSWYVVLVKEKANSKAENKLSKKCKKNCEKIHMWDKNIEWLFLFEKFSDFRLKF